jgi:hypothetical protein
VPCCRCLPSVAGDLSSGPSEPAAKQTKDKADSKDSRDNTERKDNREAHGKNSANPAITCKAMRANDLAHFEATYGTRQNAFGKCVSGHANAKS